MAEPLNLTDKSIRLGLPFLFAGQAQKEFFVNEAFSIMDLLLHPAVAGVLGDAPDTALEGECWLVAENAGGNWNGRAGMIAVRQDGAWKFVGPISGMRLYDRGTSQTLLYSGRWYRPETPTLPEAGETVDQEARAAIETIIRAMRTAGLIAAE